MAGSGEPDLVGRARSRVIAERARAANAAALAERHEALALVASESKREFHRSTAQTHRRAEERHLTAAGIQATHVARLRSLAQMAIDLGALVSPEPTRLAGATAARPPDTDAAGTGPAPRDTAWYDALTHLPNRSLFAARLGDAMTGHHDRVGVCLIDLDHFKMINDQFGHEVGDEVLVAVSERLAKRLPGRLLARLGGDEFAVLLADSLDADEAAKVAETALAAISEPVHVDGRELTVTASIGVVERPVAGADPVEVIRAADTTLSWAKSAGRGGWARYDSARDARTRARYALAVEMPGAIDRGEFFVEYQPIVGLADASLVGAEALVRWRHPRHGVLAPDRFIGLAEETGMIVRLGQTVLAQACRDAAEWATLGPHPPYVSVNVAARQLWTADLIQDVQRALDQSGLEPSQLRLEITESAIVRPGNESLSVLRRLATLGVSVAIDDFGTGYSNMSYLRRLPVQVLKIDRTFVAEIPGPDCDPGSADAQVVAAMVSLAHILGLSVIAEGVETAAQADLLRTLGCESAQGWYFGRPASAAKLRARLAGGGA